MFSLMYNYVRSRQLEGSYPGPPSIGCWPISSMRIYRGWGNPTDEQWPYDGSAANWPPNEPAHIDQLAKASRVFAYQRVRTLDECKKAVSLGLSVVAALEIIRDDWNSAAGGYVPLPRPGTPTSGAHTVCIVGYDDQKGLIKFANSWGARWGKEGYGFLPYIYFGRYQIEAWVFAAGGIERPSKKGSGVVEQIWGIPDYFASTPLHGIELFDLTNDECVGWAFIVEREGFADIEEFFVRPNYRNKGYARRLAEAILSSPQVPDLPLRFWVSHEDQQNVPRLSKMFKLLGLSPASSSCKWASYVAV